MTGKLQGKKRFQTQRVLRGLGLFLVVVMAGCASSGGSDRGPGGGQAVKAKGGGAGIEIKAAFENGSFSFDDPDRYGVIRGYPFGVRDVRGRTLGNGIKQVQAVISNNGTRSLKLNYRVQWFDESGFASESDKYPWTLLFLGPGETKPILSASRSGRVQKLTIQVREE